MNKVEAYKNFVELRNILSTIQSHIQHGWQLSPTLIEKMEKLCDLGQNIEAYVTAYNDTQLMNDVSDLPRSLLSDIVRMESLSRDVKLSAAYCKKSLYNISVSLSNQTTQPPSTTATNELIENKDEANEITIAFADAIQSNEDMIIKLNNRLDSPSTLEELIKAKNVLLKRKSALHLKNRLAYPQDVLDILQDELNELHKKIDDTIVRIDYLVDTAQYKQPTPQNQTQSPSTKIKLSTEEQSVFNKAIESGLIESDGNTYKWVGETGQKRELAYFIKKYNITVLKKPEELKEERPRYGDEKFEIARFQEIFGVTKISQEIQKPLRKAGYKKVDDFFKGL